MKVWEVDGSGILVDRVRCIEYMLYQVKVRRKVNGCSYHMPFDLNLTSLYPIRLNTAEADAVPV